LPNTSEDAVAFTSVNVWTTRLDDGVFLRKKASEAVAVKYRDS
jgi:hypothetical protein